MLNGTKAWITNAGVSEFCTVMAVTDPDRSAQGISAFVVEKKDPGVSFGVLKKKLGMNPTWLRSVRTGVVVDAAESFPGGRRAGVRRR